MAERYTRVFTQQGQFYCPDAPVIIEAGALLKDNQTGKIIAQLKFKNISPNTIRALTVKISATDVTGATVAGVDSFQYLDLNVSRDGEFGQQTPIVLPDATARSFTCQCISAVLGDKTIWNCTESTKWLLLPKPCALTSKMGAPLAEQYQRDTMPKAQYIPTEYDGLWSCACGAMNHANEQVCHSCRESKAALFGALNIEKLQANKKKHDEVIAAEKAAVAEAEKIRAAKNRKIAIIAAVALVLLIGVFILTSEVIMPAVKYNRAISLMDEGKYEDAKKIFIELLEYKDSEKLYTECGWRNGITLYVSGNVTQAEQQFDDLLHNTDDYPDYVYTEISAFLYNSAMDCIENQDYDSALSFAANNFAKNISRVIYETIYQKGIKLSAEGQHQNAIDIFMALNGYRDSKNRLHTAILDGYKDSAGKADSLYHSYKLELLKRVDVGDYVIWGTYEQDNVVSNGNEAVEWLVLAKEENRILVTSKYALDCKPYHNQEANVTWETCSLRKWLNDEFINTAFSEEEKAKIPTVTVSADKNPDYNGNPGNATRDKVFLLSVSEVGEYCPRAMECSPTAYAIARGTFGTNSGSCYWPLRTPGVDQNDCACVGFFVLTYGGPVENADYGIRPAMWIDLSDLA